jgi:DNA-binding IclR family transcriptional regulator
VSGEVPQLKGTIQRRIIAVPEMFTEAGMSASEIATELQYDEPNAYTVLRSLTDAGVVEQVEGATPRRWRMVGGASGPARS